MALAGKEEIMIQNSVIAQTGGQIYSIDTGAWNGPESASAGEIVSYEQTTGGVVFPNALVAADGTELPIISDSGDWSGSGRGYHYLFVMPAQDVSIKYLT